MTRNKEPDTPGRALSAAERATLDAMAERVRALVQRFHGGNVSEAARAIGISQPALHAIEKGKNFPRADTIAKIATAFGVSADWLLGIAAASSTPAPELTALERRVAEIERQYRASNQAALDSIPTERTEPAEDYAERASPRRKPGRSA